MWFRLQAERNAVSDCAVRERQNSDPSVEFLLCNVRRGRTIVRFLAFPRRVFAICDGTSLALVTCTSTRHAALVLMIHISDDPQRGLPPDLPRLDMAIRLKTDLISKMASSSPRQWPQHLSDFVRGVGQSGLQNTSALLVLLAEVRREVRTFAGLGTPADSDLVQLFDLAQNPHPSVHHILSRFQQVVVNDLQVAAGSISVPEVVIGAMRFMEDHYAQPITVAQVAAAVGRSPKHLGTLFRQHAGTTVHEYLVRVRLRRAVHLICSGEKIEAVSLLVGYRSKKNFYRHFRSHMGSTPSTYRTRLKIQRTK